MPAASWLNPRAHLGPRRELQLSSARAPPVIDSLSIDIIPYIFYDRLRPDESLRHRVTLVFFTSGPPTFSDNCSAPSHRW